MKTLNDFLTAIEDYYSKEYSKNEKGFISAWLIKNQSRLGDLHELLLKICESYTKNYKSLPDIAIINKCLGSGKNLELEASEVFEKVMSKVHSYRDFITDNKRIYAGIKMCGGWLSLCQSEISARPFVRKDFMKGYCSDVTGVNIEIERGIGVGYKPVIMSDSPGKLELEYANREKQQLEMKDYINYVNEV